VLVAPIVTRVGLDPSVTGQLIGGAVDVAVEKIRDERASRTVRTEVRNLAVNGAALGQIRHALGCQLPPLAS
jgi:hypothetical protein